MAVVRRAKSAEPTAPLKVNGAAAPAARPTPPAARAVVHTDPLNELIVIAACVVDWETGRKTTPLYAPDFFQVEQHRTIWEGLRTMHSRGLGWDPETLRQVSGGKADVDYLLGVIEARPDVPPNLRHHLDVLEWDRARVECARGPLSALLRAIDDPRAAPERVRALGQQVSAAFEAAGRSATPPWTDLAAAYAARGEKRNWFAEGAIEDQPLVLIVGAEKGWKSWMCIDLAVHTVTGGRWLGRFPIVRPGPVVYIDCEYGGGEFSRRVVRLARGAGRDPAEVFAGIRHLYGGVRLAAGNAGFAALLAAVEREPPKLIVLDPLRDLLVGSENDSDVVLEALDCASRLRDAARCPVVVLHHLNKSGGYSGSRALWSRPDLILEGSDDRERPEFHAAGRNVRRGDPLKSGFTIGVEHENDLDDATAASVVWSRFEGESNAQRPLSKLALTILRMLADGALSRSAIKRHTRRSDADVHRALDELQQAGRINLRDGRWHLSTGEFFAALRDAAADDTTPPKDQLQ